MRLRSLKRISTAQQSFFYPDDSFMLPAMTIKIRVSNLLKVGNPGKNDKRINKEDFHVIF